MRPEGATFQEAFCRRFRCGTADYYRRAFLLTCYPLARWFACLGGYRNDHFVLDRALVAYCGTLRTAQEIDFELNEYAALRENQKFFRRALRVRISGRRLRRLFAECVEP